MPEPVPAVLLARLAVDRQAQGRGLGAALLAHAVIVVQLAAALVGIACLLVHAKDGNAKRFYTYHGFVESPTDQLHLLLMLTDLPPLRQRSAQSSEPT